MKYVCSVCGYVYDEEVEGVPFSELPDDWACPMCKAPKSLFFAEDSEKDDVKTEHIDVIDEDMTEIPPLVLSQIFSNLARGCEKQYKENESKLFTELSEYYRKASGNMENPSTTVIAEKLSEDLSSLYPTLRERSEMLKDRGALRVTVWGEKVTRMALSLVDRYEKEGSSFLDNTKIWVCSICGFIYIGDTPPAICPVCKVPDWKFECIEGGNV